MKTKEEFRAEIERRLPTYAQMSMTPSNYIQGCIDLMFDLTAETLAEVVKEKTEHIA